MTDDDYQIDRWGKLWDRIWRGKSSSHRRAISNAALHSSRCTDALREASRLIDEVPGDRRQAEIASLAFQIDELGDGMKACAEHLRTEAGVATPRRARRLPWLRRLLG